MYCSYSEIKHIFIILSKSDGFIWLFTIMTIFLCSVRFAVWSTSFQILTFLRFFHYIEPNPCLLGVAKHLYCFLPSNIDILDNVTNLETDIHQYWIILKNSWVYVWYWISKEHSEALKKSALWFALRKTLLICISECLQKTLFYFQDLIWTHGEC